MKLRVSGYKSVYPPVVVLSPAYRISLPVPEGDANCTVSGALIDMKGSGTQKGTVFTRHITVALFSRQYVS